MLRRIFIKLSALSAAAVMIPGFISFNGRQFIGDCETTTDILGPFYRPDAPVRTYLGIPGDIGTITELHGTVYHNDCLSPLQNAMIDIWHCGPDGEYDNTTHEFRYRGKTFTDSKGGYYFRTILPIPYQNNGIYRPAHYHLLISSPGYQDLITQIYFNGDPYINKDPYSASPQAVNRILPLKYNSDNMIDLQFDITMMKNLPAEDAVLKRLSGIYYDLNKNSEPTIFYYKSHQLWIDYYIESKKNYDTNELYYIGNNTFKTYGEEYYAKFEILNSGDIKVQLTGIDKDGNRIIFNESIKKI